jgi:hypothetical protein
MWNLFNTIRDGITPILALALLALVGPALFDRPPSNEPYTPQVADRPEQDDEHHHPAVAAQGQVAPVVRPALLRVPASVGSSKSTSPTPKPTDASTISPRRGTPLPPGHTLVCDHDGCREVCTTPHPIYSSEPYTPGRYGEVPTFTRCPTCTPSRAQLLWAQRLSNYERLSRDYSDNQIIHYFGDDRLRHLAGDYLPPELDPGRVRNNGTGVRP